MLTPGSEVGVAVSGGADSVALFRALHAIAAEHRCRLGVLHVNHKLRGSESNDDAQFVRDLAAQLGSFCEIADLPIPAAGNLEQEARDLRIAWFESYIQGSKQSPNNLRKVALGHTRSDQAETVLFRFLRGSGSSGLAGIRPTLHNGFVRPLLNVSREDTREYLRQIGQPWREDSSNADLSLDRNRIRLQLLPQLAREWNPSIENTLAQTAAWALAEEEHWESVIDSLASDHFESGPGPSIVVPTSAFAAVSTAACRRLIRHAVGCVRGDLRGIDFAHVEQIRALIAQSEGSGRLQTPGVDVLRSFDWVRFANPGSYGGERHYSTPVTPPGEFSLSPGSPALLLKVESADYRYNEDVNCFDADCVTGTLVLRNWQPGDQYRPKNNSCETKLKTLFQAARVPLWERRLWPVLADASQIVWSRRFGVSAAHAPKPETGRLVVVSERQTISEQQEYKYSTVSPKPESGTGRPTSIR